MIPTRLRLSLVGTTRSLSLSAAKPKVYISHIGGKPVDIPQNVTINPVGTDLNVQGPLGSTSIFLHPFVKLDFSNEKSVSLTVEDPAVKHQRAMWGTTRTLLSNAIIGMTEGYSVPLYLVGVGYRVAVEEDPRGTADGGSGKRLNMKCGFSHTIYIAIPPHIKAEVPLATKIILSCTDKQKLGLFAAHVRSFRKPEPYKGKVCHFTIFC